MRRLLSAGASLCLLAAVAAAQTSVEQPTQGFYSPTTVGTKWVIASSEGAKDRTFEVTAIEDKDGAKIVTVSEGQKVAWVDSVSAKGVYRIQGGETKFDPPICQLKLPHKPGDKWDLEGGQLKGTMTVFEREQVEVPAGKYKAIRLELVEPTPRRGLGGKAPVAPKWTFWYAPDVGLVKVIRTGPSGVPAFVQEMKSFTPSK
jgi:hypothetical protein